MQKIVLLVILITVGLAYGQFPACKTTGPAGGCNVTAGTQCVCVSDSSGISSGACFCLDCSTRCPPTLDCQTPICEITYDNLQNAVCNKTGCKPIIDPLVPAPICCNPNEKPTTCDATCTNDTSSSVACKWLCPTLPPVCPNGCPATSTDKCNSAVAGALCNFTSCAWACPPVSTPCDCSTQVKPDCAGPVCDPSACKWACPSNIVPTRCASDACDPSTHPEGCVATCVGVTSSTGACVNAKWVPTGCSATAPPVSANCNPVCRLGNSNCSWTCAACTGTPPCPRATCLNGAWNTEPCLRCDTFCSNTPPTVAPDASCLKYESNCLPSSIDPTTNFVLSCDWKTTCVTAAGTCGMGDCANQTVSCPNVATNVACVRDPTTLHCSLAYTCPPPPGTVNCDGKCPATTNKPVCPDNFEVSSSTCVAQINSVSPTGAASDLLCGWHTDCIPSKICVPTDCINCVAVDPAAASGVADYSAIYKNCTSLNADQVTCAVVSQRTCTMTSSGCAWVSTAPCTLSSTSGSTVPPTPVCVGSDPCSCKYGSNCVFLQAQVAAAAASTVFASCISASDRAAYEVKLKAAGLTTWTFATSAPDNCSAVSPTPSDDIRKTAGGDNTASATTTLAKDIADAVSANPSSAFARFTIVIVLTFQPSTNAGKTTMTIWVDFISATGASPADADLKEFCPILQKYIKNSAGGQVEVVGDCQWATRTAKRSAGTTSYSMSSNVTGTPQSTSGVSAIFASFVILLLAVASLM